jgi:hypothetical protein
MVSIEQRSIRNLWLQIFFPVSILLCLDVMVLFSTTSSSQRVFSWCAIQGSLQLKRVHRIWFSTSSFKAVDGTLNPGEEPQFEVRLSGNTEFE